MRLAHDRRILILALLAGLPAVLLAAVLLWQSNSSALFKGTVFGAVVIVWLAVARAAQVRAAGPRRSLHDVARDTRAVYAEAAARSGRS